MDYQNRALLPWHGRYRSEEETPAWRLFNLTFPVRTKAMFVENQERNRLYGTLVFDASREYHEAQMEVDRWLTIPEMLNIHMSGGKIEILNAEDNLVTIYDVICEHIRDSAEWNFNHINGFDIPMKELRQLDEFAKVVYPKAKVWFDVKTGDSPFDDFLSSFGVFDADETKPQYADEHESFLDKTGALDNQMEMFDIF